MGGNNSDVLPEARANLPQDGIDYRWGRDGGKVEGHRKCVGRQRGEG